VYGGKNKTRKWLDDEKFNRHSHNGNLRDNVDERKERTNLTLGSNVFAQSHRDRTSDRARDGSEQNGERVGATASHAKHKQEHGDQTVVNAQNDVSALKFENFSSKVMK
jgi:hypothetical protein